MTVSYNPTRTPMQWISDSRPNNFLILYTYMYIRDVRCKMKLTSRNSNTGQPDMISWNPSLEHKTEFGPTEAANGYPDADYLDRIFAQLAHLGVISDEHDL